MLSKEEIENKNLLENADFGKGESKSVTDFLETECNKCGNKIKFRLGIANIKDVEDYIDKLETKIKELSKGQQSLMQSRRKWKNRYYKMRNKNKELQKSVEQIYDDYQDIGKIAFDYSDKIEQLEKTISRKMSNNKRLSKKYLKERYKNKQLESDKQKLIERLEEDKETLKKENADGTLQDYVIRLLEILKGENQVTVK